MCSHYTIFDTDSNIGTCKKCGSTVKCLTQHEVCDLLDKPFFTTHGMHDAKLGKDSLIQYWRGRGSQRIEE